ncbi:unnamed protein product [Debaryomyces tyrocola]|nr:unnamed protein product [Debaryomyces tyrocola]
MSDDLMEIDSNLENEQQIESKSKSSKQKFEVKKWTAVAFWSWDIIVETCAICRNHLMEPCIECQPNTLNNSNEECIAAWGMCNHAFHMHCIARWLKSRNVCPLDNREWSYQKFGN